MEGAVFDSGILDEDKLIIRASREVDFGLWHRYLVYRALHNTKTLSIRLGMIRQVSERIVEMRGLDLAHSQQAVRDCVSEICHACLVFRAEYCLLDSYLTSQRGPTVQLDENGSQFQRAIMAAAAYMNDLKVARQLLSPRSNDAPETNQMQNKWAIKSRTPVFPFDPYTAAAYKGNTEFISLLMANEPETIDQGRGYRAAIIHHASWDNQMDTLDLALGASFHPSSPDFIALRGSLVSALTHTTSISFFKRCFELVKYSLQHPCAPHDPIFYYKWLSARFHSAAECGAVALMEYLAQLGASVNGRFSDDEDNFYIPISLAALNGQESAVKWLLDRGAKLGRSLHAAVAFGSRSIVQLLIEHGAMNDTYAVQKALLEAVKKENEALFRLLVENGATLDETTIKKATTIVENEQLESIAKLLKLDTKVVASTTL